MIHSPKLNKYIKPSAFSRTLLSSNRVAKNKSKGLTSILYNRLKALQKENSKLERRVKTAFNLSNNIQNDEQNRLKLPKMLNIRTSEVSGLSTKKILDCKPFVSFAKRNDRLGTLRVIKQRASNLPGIQEDGFKLAKYNVGATIGKGAYAIVKLGAHIETGRRVAIKIYNKLKFTDPKKKACLDREIKIMKRMNHPNVVKLYEVIDTPRQLFIIMEFVKGQSLSGYIRSKKARKLPELECMRIFSQVVAGIEYCHSHNIIHRDIKMENVLLDECNNVKIIDFGFSICVNAVQRLKMFCGTPSYMTPEIVMKKDYYGQPADIWSLGILLYVMLCGQFPFCALTEPELFKCIARCHFTFPRGVSTEAKNLVTSMLQLKPEKRAAIGKIYKESCRLALSQDNNTHI